MISKFGNGKNGSEECMIVDSGCSIPVVSDKIVSKLGIKVKPFKEPINIIDASGNNLSLLGFYTGACAGDKKRDDRSSCFGK